jgi:hypothetical protein
MVVDASGRIIHEAAGAEKHVGHGVGVPLDISAGHDTIHNHPLDHATATAGGQSFSEQDLNSAVSQHETGTHVVTRNAEGRTVIFTLRPGSAAPWDDYMRSYLQTLRPLQEIARAGVARDLSRLVHAGKMTHDEYSVAYWHQVYSRMQRSAPDLLRYSWEVLTPAR